MLNVSKTNPLHPHIWNLRFCWNLPQFSIDCFIRSKARHSHNIWMSHLTPGNQILTRQGVRFERRQFHRFFAVRLDVALVGHLLLAQVILIDEIVSSDRRTRRSSPPVPNQFAGHRLLLADNGSFQLARWIQFVRSDFVAAVVSPQQIDSVVDVGADFLAVDERQRSDSPGLPVNHFSPFATSAVAEPLLSIHGGRHLVVGVENAVVVTGTRSRFPVIDGRWIGQFFRYFVAVSHPLAEPKHKRPHRQGAQDGRDGSEQVRHLTWSAQKTKCLNSIRNSLMRYTTYNWARRRRRRLHSSWRRRSVATSRDKIAKLSRRKCCWSAGNWSSTASHGRQSFPGTSNSLWTIKIESEKPISKERWRALLYNTPHSFSLDYVEIMVLLTLRLKIDSRPNEPETERDNRRARSQWFDGC